MKALSGLIKDFKQKGLHRRTEGFYLNVTLLILKLTLYSKTFHILDVYFIWIRKQLYMYTIYDSSVVVMKEGKPFVDFGGLA